MHNILVIDDEQDFLDSLKRGLIIAGFTNVQLESDPRKAAAVIEQGAAIDIALIDVFMQGMDGIELLELIRAASPDTECIMITALNDAKVAVECMKKGAYDYLVKPVSRDDLLLAVNRALERKRLLELLDIKEKREIPELKCGEAFNLIISRSVNMLKVMKEAELHAYSNVPILITGESGTGKELLARSIHAASPRAKYPFTPVNMASHTETLFNAEFFGHTKGAFTGAEKDRKGYIESTNHGTLFLDEIGTLPLELQGKLLRVLQEGEFIKLGTSHAQKTDVRFIAATNADLEQLMNRHMFRKDLYYRLKGAWLYLPPLRERKEDIPLLINKFLEEFCGVRQDRGIEELALSTLMDYDYPGNIRELRSIIQSAVNLAQGRPISANFLPSYLQSRKRMLKGEGQKSDGPIVSLAEAEKAHILRAYEETGRNKMRTAKLLDIGLNTLRRKLESYGIE